MQLEEVVAVEPDPDMARSLAFYRDGLGWEPLADVPGEIIFFQIGPGLVLGFFEAQKFGQDIGFDAAPSAVSGLTLSHNVDSRAAVDATVEAAVAAGATVLKHPQDGAFGGVYHAHIADPNGVVWEIAHNPSWRIDDAGAVILG